MNSLILPDVNLMWKAAFSLLAPAGRGAKLSTLIFHRVLPAPDPMFPGEMHAVQFDAVCGWLRRWFNVLPLDQAVRRLANGSLPPRAAAITFDDGYADNHDIALPILQRHGLNATFFVATGFLNGGRMWNDTLIEAVRRCPRETLDLAGTALSELGCLLLRTVEQRQQAVVRIIDTAKYLAQPERDQCVADVARCAAAILPNDLMMTDHQVRMLRRAGMLVGAHTVSHPILARLNRDCIRDEIGRSRDTLQNLLDEPIGLFAYPNGKPDQDYRIDAVEVVRSLGFAAAMSTKWGAACQSSDLFQLPRFTPWDRGSFGFASRLARNLL